MKEQEAARHRNQTPVTAEPLARGTASATALPSEAESACESKLTV